MLENSADRARGSACWTTNHLAGCRPCAESLRALFVLVLRAQTMILCAGRDMPVG